MRGTVAGTEVRVIPLPDDRLAEAVGVLTRSYQAYPSFVHLFPDERVRARALPPVNAVCLRDALDFGHVYVAMRDASNVGEIVGVAAWLPPYAFPLSLRRQLRSMPDMARVMVAAPRSLRRLVRLMTGLAGLHPAQPYWYLEAIGVDPASQGSGIGRRLLEPVLALADEERQSCYLETQTEQNVAWYRKLGFEVRNARVSFAPDSPPNWTMLRPPGQG